MENLKSVRKELISEQFDKKKEFATLSRGIDKIKVHVIKVFDEFIVDLNQESQKFESQQLLQQINLNSPKRKEKKKVEFSLSDEIGLANSNSV